jgi:hypothetical protein
MGEILLTYENFFEQLLSSVPTFMSIYKEHIEDNNELLHHVLMADLTRYCIQLYRNGDRGGDKEKKKILCDVLKFLDQGMLSSDAKLQELISVSFLENLWQADEDYESMKGLLSPVLIEELQRLESWRPSH